MDVLKVEHYEKNVKAGCFDCDGDLCRVKELFKHECAKFNKTISLGFQDPKKGKIVRGDNEQAI